MDWLTTYVQDRLVEAVVVVLSYYLAAYVREKGKNLATKEDIDKITKKTEEIRAQISGDLWVKQRRRELQLDVINRMNGVLADFFDSEIRWRGNRIVKQKYEQKIDELLPQWQAAHWMSKALFSDRALAAVQAVQEFIGPNMGGRPSHEFVELWERAIQILVEEACASNRI
jgi:hypothetical protein